MSRQIENLEDVIGRKIRWHSWPERNYFIPDKIYGRYIYGKFYSEEMGHDDRFYLSKGIRTKRERGEKKKLSYWYLIDDLYPVQLEMFKDG